MFEDLYAFCPRATTTILDAKKEYGISTPWVGCLDTELNRVKREHEQIINQLVDDEIDLDLPWNVLLSVESIFAAISYWCAIKNIEHYCTENPSGKDAILLAAGDPASTIHRDIFFSDDTPHFGIIGAKRPLAHGIVDTFIDVGLLPKGNIIENARLKFNISMIPVTYETVCSRLIGSGFVLKYELTGEEVTFPPYDKNDLTKTLLPAYKQILDYLHGALTIDFKSEIPAYPTEKDLEDIRTKLAEKEEQEAKRFIAETLIHGTHEEKVQLVSALLSPCTDEEVEEVIAELERKFNVQ